MDHSVLCCVVPGELVIDILSRLPVKSLIRFKTVCKSWNSLTRDPHFISKHSNVSEAAKLSDKNISLLVLRYRIGPKPSISIESSNATSKEIFPVTLPFDMNDDSYRLSVVGFCDGIICVHGYRQRVRKRAVPGSDLAFPGSDLALFNPATREAKVIPMSPRLYPTHFGFGYDPKTNDYKVVQIIGSGKKTEVYSLKQKSWKLVEASCTPCIYPSGSVHVNGFCYWWGRRDSRKVLISFDMTKEEFGYVDLPDKAPEYGGVKILAIDGYLCLVWPTLVLPYLFSMWVMVNNVWKNGKLAELPGAYSAASYTWRGRLHAAETRYELVMVGHNGDIVLLDKCDGLLKLYNKSTREVTPMQVGATRNVSNIVSCKETLFSLH